MELDFYKLNLCGNDFILFNLLKGGLPSEESRAKITRHISRRTEGVGSNGVIFLSENPEFSATVHHYNYAGIKTPCFDAYLCASKFLFDYGFSRDGKISFFSSGSVVTVDSIDSLTFRISTGVARTENEEMMRINGNEYMYTPVSFDQIPGAGAVFFFFNKNRKEKEEIARLFNLENDMSRRYKTVFTTVYSNDEIKIEPVFRRLEKDMIFAASVAGSASSYRSYCDNEILVNCKGGELFFQKNETTNNVYITGKPEYVFRGNYYFDESDN